MANKLGVCPNCKKEIIVNDSKKAGVCPSCNEAYVKDDALSMDVPKNKKLGVSSPNFLFF